MKCCCRALIMLLGAIGVMGTLFCNDRTMSLRDPFFLPRHVKEKRMAKESLFFLCGVVCSGDGRGALIRSGQETLLVSEGDSIEQYLVKEIGNNSVTLIKGRQTKKLCVLEE